MQSRAIFTFKFPGNTHCILPYGIRYIRALVMNSKLISGTRFKFSLLLKVGTALERPNLLYCEEIVLKTSM